MSEEKLNVTKRLINLIIGIPHEVEPWSNEKGMQVVQELWALEDELIKVEAEVTDIKKRVVSLMRVVLRTVDHQAPTAKKEAQP